MTTPALTDFDTLTFDCYGTLVDWERGILAAAHQALDGTPGATGLGADDERLLDLYARFEAQAEAGPYLPYRQVLAHVLRGMAGELGVEPTPAAVERFSASVGDWPPFPDSAAALGRLAGRYRLGVITNCDTDLFARTNERLGIRFDWVITAQQLGSYKPNPRNFELALDQIGGRRDRHLHVAQSLFHDHVPAQALGLRTVWIDRRHGRPGSGASLPATVTPDFVFPDMASFAAAAIG